MKKQSLLLIGGAMLAFASCQQENTAGGGFTQEQVDSIVNARVEEQMMALQASNDSTINALAQMKADSIIAAMKGGKVTTSKTTTTTTKNTTVNNGGSTTTPPANPKGDRFNGTTSNTTKKESRFNEDAAKKQQEDNTQKKADRFSK